MTKNELIATLKKLRNVEELAIPIYTQHLNSTFFLSGFEQDTERKIKETLLVLAKESEGHARIFKGLIKKIQESNQNVY